MSKLVVKIGGRGLDDHALFTSLLEDIALHIKSGTQCVLVHGGGSHVSEYCNTHDIPVRFDSEGKRITDKASMEASDMILGGAIRNTIMRACTNIGLHAVGLSCIDHALVEGRRTTEDSYTGQAVHCNVDIITLLTAHAILPVVNSTSYDSHGNALNINADEVAQTIAQTWSADHLLFLSDTPGVQHNDTLIPSLTPKHIAQYIQDNTISGGMVIKTQSAITSLAEGVDSIVIGNFSHSGDIQQLLHNKKGTKITHE